MRERDGGADAVKEREPPSETVAPDDDAPAEAEVVAAALNEGAEGEPA